MRAFLVSFVIVICGVFVFSESAAQNVLVNGNFNGDITTGWNQVAFQAGPTFDGTRDCCADAVIGSLRTVPTNNNNWTAIDQCVGFSQASNHNFQFSAWVQINSVVSPAQLTNATVVAQFNTASDCINATAVGPILTLGAAGTGMVAQPFTFYELRARTTPVGAQFVHVFVSIRRGVSIDANFDHIFLGPDINDTIFADSFE
jgi:hypothetical protein